ncbi:MAG: type III pantothenate kinase [Steroidobacterales bacterium]
MNLLLLDIGNSRLKWAVVRQRYRRGQPFAAQGVMEIRTLRSSVLVWPRLFKAAGTPDTIYACNVAGRAVERRMRAAARRAGVGVLHFARSQAAGAGVRNGYRESWRLGVDRWLGLIGARHEHPGKDLCLVGLGTAMTIDLLDAAGRHFGGSLVPGPRLMIESLLEHTAGIRRRAGGWGAASSFDQVLGIGQARGSSASRNRPAALFAHDTHAALLAGARHACAALIGRAMSEARSRLGRRPRLIISGGAAVAITPLLHARYWRQDDLVLRGLAVLANARAPDRIKSACA